MSEITAELVTPDPYIKISTGTTHRTIGPILDKVYDLWQKDLPNEEWRDHVGYFFDGEGNISGIEIHFSSTTKQFIIKTMYMFNVLEAHIANRNLHIVTI